MVTLEENKLFCRLSPAELKTLRRIAQERTLMADQEIFKEGDAGDGVYVVKDGVVEISVRAGQTGRHVFTQIEPGEIFGEMAVIEDKPRSAGAVARKESVVYFIPRAEMLDLIAHAPMLGFGLLREISRRLREFNHHYMREVLQAERLAVVGRFARSIVHDLKNPLNIISLTAEMASMEQVKPEAQEKAMTDIRHQVERINELVGEILDFTQGASSELVLPPMDYATFVRQTMDQIRSETVLRSVTIEFENEPPSISLLLNPKRLRRVFYNLIHNAIDAMPRGGKIIWRFSLKPNEIITEVEDTGPGVPPEMAGQLFEAFATHGKAHGTGLGLSICKKIIEDHRGRIALRNEPGHGAIFAFALPRIPEAQSAS